MVISAHWLTQGSFVSCTPTPHLIYDFYGFPEELYKIRYDCKGAPEFADHIVHGPDTNQVIYGDYSRGLDHASYSILKYLYPEADIPVFEMSLDYSFQGGNVKPIGYHYELGKRLQFLRENGVLIIGSGNIVHNLRHIDYNTDAYPFEWAVQADNQLKKYLDAGDHQGLIDYPVKGVGASLPIPTLDHYLPMIYTLALQEDGESIRYVHEGFQNGSISMRSFIIENNA